MSRRTFTLLLILLAVTAVSARPSIAVADLEAIGCEESIGQAVAEIMLTEVARGDEFTVIERAQLQSLLAEQSLGASGLVTSDTAVGIGALLGADVIVVGSVSKLGDTYTLSARAVSVATGEVLASKTDSCRKEDGLVKIATAMAELARNNLPEMISQHGKPAAWEAYRTGVAQLQAKQPEQALESFLEAIKLDPEIPAIYLATAKLANKLGKVIIARRVASAYLEQFPEGPHATQIRKAIAEADASAIELSP